MIKTLIALSLTALFSIAHAEKKPNLIFILIDDAGYDDFGFTGCTDWKTPHIDSIAHKGATFSDGYVTASVCGPSRAGLITGRYQQSFGHEENITGGQLWKTPAEKFGLPVDIPTLGTLLQKQGYKTSVFGKWHLGEHANFHPNKRGFDHFVGFLGGSRAFFPLEKARHGHQLMVNDQKVTSPEYLTDHLGKEAAKFIRENKQNPFFMYLAYNAVHSPLQATDADLASLSHLNDKKRQVLGAMTVSLDRSIGIVLDELKAQGLTDNTIVVFSNDNGAATYLKTNNAGLRGRKGSVWEGGLRVPFAVQYPSQIKINTHTASPVNTLDVGYTFCKLAGYSNEELAALKLPGTDLVALASGKSIDRSLYWKRGNTSAIRHGDWKLITLKGEPRFLFNLNKDKEETHNALKKQPEIASRLDNQLKSWEATLPKPLWRKKQWDDYDKYLLKYWKD